LLATGKLVTPNCIAIAIITMFEIVPNPGRSPNGHQKKRTIAEIKKVAEPILIPVFKEIPCAKTDHGALPVWELTINASPKPKIVRPKKSINTRPTDKSHRLFPVQDVVGMVR
jgi:hypothetical protein